MDNPELTDDQQSPYERPTGLKGLWANNPPYSKFLIALGTIITATSLFTVLSVILASIIYGVKIMQFETLLGDYNNPLSLSILKFIQTFSTIGTFIVPAFVIGWLLDKNPFKYLKLNRSASVIS